LFRQAVPFSPASTWFVVAAMVCFLGLAFMPRPSHRSGCRTP
jgi:hypothetical protein